MVGQNAGYLLGGFAVGVTISTSWWTILPTLIGGIQDYLSWLPIRSNGNEPRVTTK
jgi:hypothetical protein